MLGLLYPLLQKGDYFRIVPLQRIVVNEKRETSWYRHTQPGQALFLEKPRQRPHFLADSRIDACAELHDDRTASGRRVARPFA